MTSSLKRRIERLQRTTPVGADIEWARAIMRAFDMVRDHPEQAADEDRALAAATSNEDWQRAFSTLIDAAGGLAAVVQGSYELERQAASKELAQVLGSERLEKPC
jgi:hypothetical protein